MAFAKGYEHDIFISYARADDRDLNIADRGWVAELVLRLSRVLSQKLKGADELRIFFDRRDLQGNQQLDDLLKAVGNSAIFLAIASPAYSVRPWTVRELNHFTSICPDPKRMFVVECLPLEDGESYPAPIDTHARMKFFEVDELFSTTAMPMPQVNSAAFNLRVYELAGQIAKKLTSLNVDKAADLAVEKIDQAARAAGVALPAAGMSVSTGQVVVVPQTTDDVENDRLKLRSFLQQYGYEVLPADDYPFGGEAFRAALSEDLKRADFFVELLGPRPGRRPSDVSEGLPQAQLDAARAAGVEVALWRHPDLDFDFVTDAAHRGLLEDEAVVASGLETFKLELKERLQKRAQPAAPPIETMVLVNSDDVDMDVAHRVYDEFKTRGLSVMVPIMDGNAKERREQLREIMSESKVVVILHGHAKPSWVQAILFEFHKLRGGAPAMMCAVMVGPPEDRAKDVPIHIPNVTWIKSGADWNIEPVIDLIKRAHS